MDIHYLIKSSNSLSLMLRRQQYCSTFLFVPCLPSSQVKLPSSIFTAAIRMNIYVDIFKVLLHLSNFFPSAPLPCCSLQEESCLPSIDFSAVRAQPFYHRVLPHSLVSPTRANATTALRRIYEPRQGVLASPRPQVSVRAPSVGFYSVVQLAVVY